MRCNKIEFIELSKEILDKGCSLRFQANGSSMYPAIRDGDIINIEPVNEKEIKLGDVIFYRTNDIRMAAHRVINKFFQNGKSILVTEGDFNTGKEEVILRDVLGKVKAIERNGRIINLTYGVGRLMDLSYAKISPFIRRPRLLGARLVRYIQGFRIYRSLVKKMIKANIVYKFESYNGEEDCLLANRNGKIIGKTTIINFLKDGSLYKGWWIFGMWVNWRYRGLGIGKQLTRMSCDFVAESGASEVKLLVFKDNKPALNLYQEIGFREISIPQIDKELKKEAKRSRRLRIIMARGI